MGRIEMLFSAADQIAEAVSRNRIPMAEKVTDPNSDDLFEPVSWPESWLRYKDKVKKAEQLFGREPMTAHQWRGVEMYLDAQYGLKL